ncbi:hairy-related 3 [Takifugu flavidus]|uniref:Transcription factor HES-1 C-HAIRY1 Hairy and enhancer of split 1 n=1 Tax=Takifugu flavidus TaxID=433684 RepID=A0A5C6MP15_9TELE|nr:hairy-related 3 [Takifugu flavidus]TWW56475.1 Transcription factor HES-1 C-HAIRY1 Hairy and enhancer of split 1 [Takifugu flavidus]
MVATTDSEDPPKHVSGKKVSKPLMEKKRRARINKCLDQLKILLESYYSTSIRKRKLEKADILELTVNHLRNLQKHQSCNIASSESSDHQSGFRRCAANVDQFLLMADSVNGIDRWMLSQLSAKLWRPRGGEDAISTTDSGPSRAPARDKERRIQPKAHEATKGTDPAATDVSALPTEDTRPRSGSRRTEAAPNDAGPANTETDSAAERSESTNVPHMWRPW